MILTAQNLLTTVTTIGIFSLFLAILILVYRLIIHENEFAKKEKSAFSDYKKTLDKASKEAGEIIDHATLASENLYHEAKNTNESVAENLDRILQQMAEKHIKSLADEVVTFRKEYEDKILQMQQQIDQNTKFVIQNTQYNLKKNLEDFSKSMLEKRSASAEMIDQKTKELLIEAEKDISEYKKSEIEKIDKAIVLLVQKTYQSLLGENIPPEINRDMIIKALEKSKKEGLFDI